MFLIQYKLQVIRGKMVLMEQDKFLGELIQFYSSKKGVVTVRAKKSKFETCVDYNKVSYV